MTADDRRDPFDVDPERDPARSPAVATMADDSTLDFDMRFPDDAPDAEKRAAARRISRLFGVDDLSGRSWNKGAPFADGATYLNVMRSAVRSGDAWGYFATPELKEFEAADDAGKLELARKALDTRGRRAAVLAEDVLSGIPMPEKMDGATEEERAAAGRLRQHQRQKSDFQLAYMTGGQPDEPYEPRPAEEDKADRALVDAWRRKRDDAAIVEEHRAKIMRENLFATWSGFKEAVSPRAQRLVARVFAEGRMPVVDKDDFLALPEGDQAVVAQVASMVRGADAPKPGLMNTLGDAGVGFLNVAMQTSHNVGRYLWNRTAGMMPDEERNRRAREEQRLMEALGDPAGLNPSGAQHGYAARSLIGLVSTVPYMGYAMIPYAGPALVALDAVQRFEDSVAAAGGDVAQGPEWEAQKLMFGALYAGVERLSAIPIFKGTGDIALRAAFLKMFTRHGGPAAARIALHIGKSTLSETLEESGQAVLEEYAVATGLKLDDKARRAFRAGLREFGETVGTMGLVSTFGAGLQGARTRSAKGRAALLDYAVASLRRESFLAADRPGNADIRLQEHQAAVERYRDIWLGGGTEALERRAGLSRREAADLGDVFAAQRDALGAAQAIAARNMFVQTGDGGADPSRPKIVLTPKSVRTIVESLGEGAEQELAGMGFTEQGAALVAGYYRAEAAADAAAGRATQTIKEKVERAVPDPDAQEAAAVFDELRPLRSLWARAGTTERARKAFRELGFDEKQAALLTEAFDLEHKAASSPGAAAAYRAHYLENSGEMTVADRARGMAGWRVEAAPDDAGDGSFTLARDTGAGENAAAARVVVRPATAAAFNPEDPGAAESVEEATRGTANPVTAAQWRAMTPEQRADLAVVYGLGVQGAFEIVDPDGGAPAATSEGAKLLTGQITIAPDARSANLYHEATHAWAAMMRRAGLLTDEDVRKLRAAYGPAADDPAWFNEERLSDDVREWQAGKTDTAERLIPARFAQGVRRVLAAVGLVRARREAAADARQQLYESIVYGSALGVVGDIAPVRAAPAAAGPAAAGPAAGDAAAGDPASGAVTAKKPAPAAADKTAAPAAAAAAEDDRKEEAAARPPPRPLRGDQWRAATPRGNVSIGGYWIVAPRDRFISDTDPRYDFSLQERRRDATRGSAEQVADIAAPGVFDPLRLLDSPDTANGAPFAAPVTLKNPETGKDETYYMIVSGNGRMRALDAVDADHRGDEYRNPLRRFADERGIPYKPADMTAETRPRLVRIINRVPVGATMQQIASLSNQNAVLQMTDAEQAAADAELIAAAGAAADYSANKDGLPSKTGSDEFFAWFVQATGDASLADSKGRPTDTARERARRAMLALAIGRGARGRETVMAFTENAETLGLERQRDALLMSAGHLAQTEAAAPDYALGDEMSRAAAAILEIARDRKAGKTADASSYLAQGDMIDAMPEATAEVLRLLDSDRPAELIAEAFRRYAELAGKIDTRTADMFGVPPAPPAELLQKAVADTALPAGRRYSLAAAIAARRYALKTGMDAEGERLMGRQLEFLFARHMDPAYRESRARATETRRAKAAAAQRARTEAARDAAGRALEKPDDPQAWADAFAAAADGTVSRIVHDFFMGGDGRQEFPHAYDGKLLYGSRVDTPHDAAALLMPLRNPYQESFKAIYLDKKNRVLGAEVCTIGLLNSAPVHPRETFRRGLRLGASKVVLGHNHPSGDPSPSAEDSAITQRLEAAANIIGLEIVDHIITNGQTYYSMHSHTTWPVDGPDKADWEAVAAGAAVAIRESGVAASLARTLRQGAENVVHAVILDTKNRVTAVKRVAFDPARIGDAAYQNETVLREMFQAAVENPAGAIMLDIADINIAPAAAQALHRRAKAQAEVIGIPILDAIYRNENGWAFSIRAGERIMPLEPAAAAEPTAKRYSLQAAADALFDKAAAADPDRVELVPVGALSLGRPETAESVDNADRRMRAAASGNGPRRAPVQVVDNGDGTADVIDGGATALAAARMGVRSVWAEVLPRVPGGWTANTALFVAQRPGAGPRYATLDDLYRAAEKARPDFTRMTETAARAGGYGLHMRKALKPRSRAEQKLREEYNGDTSQVRDVWGGTLALEPGQRFGDALAELERAGFGIVRVKNLFIDNTPATGYRDIKVNVRTPDGFTGEVILIERKLLEKKKETGHDIYKEIRDANAVLKQAPDGDAKAALGSLINTMERASAAYYGASDESYAEVGAAFAGAAAALNAASRSTIDQASSSLRTGLMFSWDPQNILPRVLTRFPSTISSLKRSSSPGSTSDTTPVSVFHQKFPDRSLIPTPFPFGDRTIIRYPDAEVNGKDQEKTRYSLQSRRLEPFSVPDHLAEVSAGTSVSALSQTKFKDERARHKALRDAQDWSAAEDYARTLAGADATALLGNYLLAKYHGDADAARIVVLKWAKPEEAAKIKAALGDTGLLRPVIAAPAPQKEGARFNALPTIYAAWLAQQLGGSVSRGFRKVEGSGSPNTGAAMANRVTRDYAFDGGEDIDGASPVILVDDVWTSGQTLWTVYEHLKSVNPDAHVAAFATLASGRYGKNIRPTPKQLTSFWEKSTLSTVSFKERVGNDIEKLTGSEIQAYILTGGRGADAAAAFFGGGGSRRDRGVDPEGGEDVRRAGSAAPVRYALDLRFLNYSKEGLLTAFTAHAMMSGAPIPSPDSIRHLADAIGLESHDYNAIRRAAATLADTTVNEAIRKAAASGRREDATFAVGELAREATARRLVSAGAAEGERLARAADRISALSEAEARRAMHQVAGAEYSDIQGDTGWDIAQTILLASPDAFAPGFAKPAQPSADMGAGGAAGGDPLNADTPDGTAAADPTETDEDAPGLTDKQRHEIARRRREREDRVRELLQKILERGAELRDAAAARRRLAEAEAQKQEAAAGDAADADVDVDGAEEGGAGAADETAAGSADVSAAELAALAEAVPEIGDQWDAAAFLRVWAFDRFRRDNPHRDYGPRGIEKDPVAVEFYRKTAVKELTTLARKLLEPGYIRETVAALVGDIDPGLTANQIERRSAYIFAMVNRHAIRQSRAKLVRDFRREIKARFVKGAEFEELATDADRRLAGAVEEDARYIMRVCILSERSIGGADTAIERERAALNEVIAQRRGLVGVDGEPLPAGDDDMEVRRALRRLALLDTYGAMTAMMPGEIRDLSQRALDTLEQEAVALRQHWQRYHDMVKAIREPLVAALMRGPDDPVADESALGRFADSLTGMLRLRLDYLTRHTTDPEATRAAIADFMDLLARGNTAYATSLADDNAALNAALGQVFRTASGNPDTGAIGRYLKELDEPIPADLSTELSKQGLQGRMTRGQMLQLLVSLEQVASYAGNIEKNGRTGQAALIRGHATVGADGTLRHTLTNEDVQLVEWLRRTFYTGKRTVLSRVFERLAGRPVDNPDPLYCPAVMLGERNVPLHADTGRWDPLAKVFSRRVRNTLDFDENASIIDVFRDRSRETALLVGYSERGMVLRAVLTSQAFQGAVRRYHGKRQLSVILRQVEQALNGGRDLDKTEGEVAAGLAAMRVTAYTGIGYNFGSALKQSVSLPVFANVVGFRNLFRILLSYDRDAVRRLRESDEYRARYGTGPAAGMDIATKAAYENPKDGAFRRFFGDWGFAPMRFMDWAVSAWVGQGVYRDLRAGYIDRGMSPADADRRAISETFSLIEETQQSGRTENLTSLTRNHGVIGKILTQFATSPLQQMQYELSLIRKWSALRAEGGRPENIREAGNRAVRAIFINHILVPAAMEMIVSMYKTVLGDEPDWKEDDYAWQLLVAALMGQFSRIFMVGALTESTLRALFMREYPRGGDIVPAEGVIRFSGNLAFAMRDIATWDTDKIHGDIRRIMRSMSATRVPWSLYENYLAEDEE